VQLVIPGCKKLNHAYVSMYHYLLVTSTVDCGYRNFCLDLLVGFILSESIH